MTKTNNEVRRDDILSSDEACKLLKISQPALNRILSKKLGLCTSASIRQAVINKVGYNNKIKELEERIVKLENKK